ncbi:unnamed protein product [Vitrella brassicaformis CCMP3155]|uniref:Uncharacterized protein n=2 Tax=Vitrella brassicaformis TaxID=1169539 RepID=A0A0G4GVP2_VITBC|nr:unnamed protein product [Vitrella brassicaformis CCMP3155]|eukprot:CEM35018.1 unnamed protein product [Vitrella brassicaformis CCMP3155]
MSAASGHYDMAQGEDHGGVVLQHMSSDSYKKAVAQNRAWTPEEDNVLYQLVSKFGPRWTEISRTLKERLGVDRLGKQCRERWYNHVDPNIKRGEWTAEEDAYILEKQAEVGNRWAEIAKKLNGRTENAVKNRFISLINRNLRAVHLAMSSESKPAPAAMPHSLPSGAAAPPPHMQTPSGDIRSPGDSSTSSGPTGPPAIDGGAGLIAQGGAAAAVGDAQLPMDRRMVGPGPPSARPPSQYRPVMTVPPPYGSRPPHPGPMFGEPPSFPLTYRPPPAAAAGYTVKTEVDEAGKGEGPGSPYGGFPPPPHGPMFGRPGPSSELRPRPPSQPYISSGQPPFDGHHPNGMGFPQYVPHSPPPHHPPPFEGSSGPPLPGPFSAEVKQEDHPSSPPSAYEPSFHHPHPHFPRHPHGYLPHGPPFPPPSGPPPIAHSVCVDGEPDHAHADGPPVSVSAPSQGDGLVLGPREGVLHPSPASLAPPPLGLKPSISQMSDDGFSVSDFLVSSNKLPRTGGGSPAHLSGAEALVDQSMKELVEGEEWKEKLQKVGSDNRPKSSRAPPLSGVLETITEADEQLEAETDPAAQDGQQRAQAAQDKGVPSGASRESTGSAGGGEASGKEAPVPEAAQNEEEAIRSAFTGGLFYRYSRPKRKFRTCPPSEVAAATVAMSSDSMTARLRAEENKVRFEGADAPAPSQPRPAAAAADDPVMEGDTDMAGGKSVLPQKRAREQ